MGGAVVNTTRLVVVDGTLVVVCVVVVDNRVELGDVDVFATDRRKTTTIQ